MAVERHLAFQPQSVARTQPAGHQTKLLARFGYLIPYPLARRDIGRDVNLETVFRRVTRPGNQCVRQVADRPMLEPVILDLREIDIRKLLQRGFAFGPRMAICVQ
jgi:hypothetical protein